MNNFVRTKSSTASKFSKMFFEQLYTGWIVCTYIAFFSLWRQMAPQQSAKFSAAFFGQFRTSLRKDSVANYASIWTLFSLFVRGPDVLSNALNASYSSSVDCATRFANLRRKFAKTQKIGRRVVPNTSYGYC